MISESLILRSMCPTLYFRYKIILLLARVQIFRTNLPKFRFYVKNYKTPMPDLHSAPSN